jgi:transposase InsO family protein
VLEEMRAIFEASGGTYGSPRIQRPLMRHRLAAQGLEHDPGRAPGENAHMESLFHSLKADVIHGRRLETVTDLRQQLRGYIRYCNHQRLHSALGYSLAG